MIDLTVAITTFNGAERFPLVLEKLWEQTQTEGIAWEVIIVDNNSNDETSSIVRQYQEKWVDRIPLKYFFEAQQGQTFARIRAIQESRGELIGFLDDDNIPALDWVYQAYKFAKENPKAGAYGSQIHADFEIEPPKDIEKIIGFLAIRERGDSPNLYRPEVLSLPPGAGLVFRKQVLRSCYPRSPQFTGRDGKSMIVGDDYEILAYIYKAGWEIWYNSAMTIDHKIPARRLERDYLISLIHGCCLPLFPLRMVLTKNWQKPEIFLRVLVGNLYRAAKHRINYWGRLKTDIIAECELQIHLSKISSIFYYFNQSLSFFFKK